MRGSSTLCRPRESGDPYAAALRFSTVGRRLSNNDALWLWVPWVHDTSATPARVLWRWDNVMASSALRSGLRSTACMQAVDLKTKLHLRLTGRHRRSVENCGVTRSLPRSGPAATSLSGPSNWPSAGGGGIAATSWHASRTCGTAWAKALRWDIPQSRSLAGWRANMVVSSSAMSQSIVSSIIVRPRRITGTACCRAINSDEGAADAQAAALPASSNNDARSLNDPPRSKAAMCRAIGEADFMLFARYGQGLLVLHERQTRFSVVLHPLDRKAV